MEKDVTVSLVSISSPPKRLKYVLVLTYLSRESHYEKDLDIDGILCSFILLFD